MANRSRQQREWSRVALAAWLIVGVSACSGGKNQSEADAGARIVVTTQVLGTGDVRRILRYSGDIEAQADIRVFSTIPDRIMSLNIAEGDTVKSGQILAVIRSSGLNETVTQARSGLDAMIANVEGLKDQLARQERLRSSGVIPEAQIEATRTQLAAAEAQVRQLEATTGLAQIRRTDAIVRAPISGVIGRLFLKVGDLAGPGVPIATVVQMDRVKVSFDIPESEFGLIAKDRVVDIRVQALGDRTFSGRVTSVSPTIDILSRTARVEVGLDNQDHTLRPGMLAEVAIEVDRHEGVLVAPFDALLMDPRVDGMGYRAFVVNGKRAEERKLKLGYVDQGMAEVMQGLVSGENLIIEGQHLLEDGAAVEVVSEAPGTGGDAAARVEE